MVIDAHIHIGKKEFAISDELDFEFDLFRTYEEIIDLMDKNGIDRAVIFPISHYQIDAKKSNDYILEACRMYPNRFIPFCRIDENLEENLKSKKFQGVKIHLLYEHIEIKNIKKELQIIEDAGVPVILHALFTKKIKQVEKMLKYAPNLKIILAHMGRGNLYTGEQVVENAIGLKKYKNVYFDLSTVGDIKAIINCCEIVGYDRVLFASDYPFGPAYLKEKYSYREELETVKNAIPQDSKELILFKNLENIISLQDEKYVHIRRAKKNDFEEIIKIFEKIDEKDKKFLALKNKYALVKQIIKSERHCYVAEMNGEIVGFMRESGRPDNYSLLEEIVVDPDFREKGIASSLLQYYHNIFRKTLAKTNAENSKMKNLLSQYGYTANNPEAKRIVNWERNEEM